MTARIARLRIAGFKSFPEAVSLDILPGLTGIVGPNGCGKSNVVEALRWAMGENSARSLRGGEMDDLIFAGTGARPSRNLAEVTITLEGSPAAPLPSPFEADAELHVTRRIERGAGSSYRANGRELRARDVQTLFADLASGARASAMVSQGRVAALVNARPEERRHVLEEAAGVTGLHARRHEAELKLRATEANLVRAQDHRAQLETGRDAVRRQVVHAARYRAISGLIRQAEAGYLAVLHAQAGAGLAEAQSSQAAFAAEAEAQAAALAKAIQAVTEAKVNLAGPLEAEAEARDRVHKSRIDSELLGREAEQALQARVQSRQRLAECAADLADAVRLDADAEAAEASLNAEYAELAQQSAALPAQLQQAHSTATAAAARTVSAGEAARRAGARAADAAADARHAALAIQTAADHRAQAQTAWDSAVAARQAAEREMVSQRDIDIAAERLAGAAARCEEATAAASAAADMLRSADNARAQAAAEALRARGQRDAAATCREAAGLAAARAATALAEIERELAAALQAGVPAAEVAFGHRSADAAAATAARCEAEVRHAEAWAMQASEARLVAVQACEAADRAQAAALAALEAADSRLAAITAELDGLWLMQESATATRVAPEHLEAARQDVLTAERHHASADRAAGDATRRRIAAMAAFGAARDRSTAADAAQARIAAEIEGLRSASAGDGSEATPALDAVEVPSGLEAAVGAALADGADLSFEDTAARFWRALPPLPAIGKLPGRSLAGLLPNPLPPPLQRAFAHTALLDDSADGDAAQASLQAGWLLVGRDGASWRWDGRVTRAGAPNAASRRLALRRRLRDADQAAAAVTAQAAEWHATETLCAAEVAAATVAEAGAVGAAAAAHAAWQTTLATMTQLAAQAASAETQDAVLQPAAARLTADLASARQDHAAAAASVALLPPQIALRTAKQDAQHTATTAAEVLVAARTTRDDARAHAHKATAAAWAIAAAAADAQARLAALTPQRDRLRLEADASAAVLAAAEAAEAVLPDLAALLADAGAAEFAAGTAAAEHAVLLSTRDQAQQALAAATSSLADLTAAQSQAAIRLEMQGVWLARAHADLQAATIAASAACAHAAALLDPAISADNATMARADLASAQADETHANARCAEFDRQIADARARLPMLACARQDWQARRSQAADKRASLTLRHAAAIAEDGALAAVPDLLAKRAAAAREAAARAEAVHAQAATALADAETRRRDAAAAQHASETRLAAARESLARGEGVLQAAAAAMAAVQRHATEKLGPEIRLPDLPDGLDLAAAEERARQKRDRLLRERDEMGPVNLRAELELDELDARTAAIEAECREFDTAIAKLRGHIGRLNHEGRTRLAEMFNQIDRHFRALFTGMMGGGRAHLALTGSDDPLEAGLEIFAEPPGKKLRALSLLSGGEQALTALSLIFAVFRCTPAPIAVLDEVDAPLDDANVERFCTLLDQIVRETGTRFLVVTHHQLTMSRMDRLFGVTMQERGVSRFLSVDLRRAAEMAEPVLQAAE